MEKRLFEIYKTITQKIAPILASFGSIIAVTYYFFKTTQLGANFLETSYEPLLAVLSSLLGAIIAYGILIIVKSKRNGKIFISYNHEDKKFVEKLIGNLKSRRFAVLYDDDIIKIGDNIQDKIDATIKQSDVVLLILSKNSSNSNYTQYEIEKSLEYKKKILPIVIDSNTKVPQELEGLKYGDFTGNYDINMRLLIKSLISSTEITSASAK